MELRDPSPSPERPINKKRERTDILGYVKRLEELEKPREAVSPEKKPKKRAKKAKEPQPLTVHDAVLKHLEGPATTNTEKKNDADDDLFDELFGGPEHIESTDIVDLEAQLELDLSEL